MYQRHPNDIDLTGITSAFSVLTSVTADGGEGSDTYHANAATLPAAVTMAITDSGVVGSDSIIVDAGSQLLNQTVLNPTSFSFQEASRLDRRQQYRGRQLQLYAQRSDRQRS